MSEAEPPQSPPTRGAEARTPCGGSAPVPLRLLIPNVITLLALVPRPDRDPLRLRGPIEWAVTRDRGGGGARRARRPHRARAEGHLALRGGTRFARRFRRFRRRAGASCSISRAWTSSTASAGCGACVRHRLRAAARAFQRDDRRSRHRPPWRKGFFVGMPAPAGAVVGLLPVYLQLLGSARPRRLAVAARPRGGLRARRRAV